MKGFDFTDITYHRANEAPVVRIAFDRPEVRNAYARTLSTSSTPHWTTLESPLTWERSWSRGTVRLLKMEGGRSAAVATQRIRGPVGYRTTRQALKGAMPPPSAGCISSRSSG